jgi:hypothetical protein
MEDTRITESKPMIKAGEILPLRASSRELKSRI